MESVLSLDNGRWLAEESGLLQGNDVKNNDFQLGNIRQPSPPSVLAQVLPKPLPISLTRVVDPRPRPLKLSQDGLPSSNSYQDLHIVADSTNFGGWAGTHVFYMMLLHDTGDVLKCQS